MSNLLSGLMFLGVAMGLLTYWIIMMFKDRTSLSGCFALLISGIVTAVVLLIFENSYADPRKIAEFVGHLFTPAMVCLAIPLYQQVHLLKKSSRLILASAFSGILGSAFSILFMWVLFGATHEEYICHLPNSLSSAVSLGLSEASGILIVIISIIMVVTELIGYIIINFMSKLVCENGRASDKVNIDSLRDFATVVTCIMIAATNAFLMELL